MSKFRKKPVVIEAEQYLVANSSEPQEKRVKGVCYCSKRGHAHVHTIHKGQVVQVLHGDWIVREPDGIHFYPVKPDIFEATYEAEDEYTFDTTGPVDFDKQKSCTPHDWVSDGIGLMQCCKCGKVR